MSFFFALISNFAVYYDIYVVCKNETNQNMNKFFSDSPVFLDLKWSVDENKCRNSKFIILSQKYLSIFLPVCA